MSIVADVPIGLCRIKKRGTNNFRNRGTSTEPTIQKA